MQRHRVKVGSRKSQPVTENCSHCSNLTVHVRRLNTPGGLQLVFGRAQAVNLDVFEQQQQRKLNVVCTGNIQLQLPEH